MMRSAEALVHLRPGQALARAIAVLGLLLVVVLSLIPHNLPVRTGVIPGPAEHFLAYLVEGAVLAYAFPRHVALAVVLLIGSAAGLEMFQVLVDRHPRLIDAAGGMLGAIIGCSLVWLVRAFRKTPR